MKVVFSENIHTHRLDRLSQGDVFRANNGVYMLISVPDHMKNDALTWTVNMHTGELTQFSWSTTALRYADAALYTNLQGETYET